MRRFVWELEVLTPLHIGSGGQWTTFDYIYDPTTRLLRIIDLNRVLAQPRVNPDDLARHYERRGFQIGQYLRDRNISPTAVELYHLPCASDPRDQPVRVFTKTSLGRPYLPGSTLKGAIRTAVLWQLLQSDEVAFTKALDYFQRVGRNDRTLPRSAHNRQWTGSNIERLPEALGPDPNTDLMRVIQIEDSPELPLETLEVVEVSSYLLNAQGQLERDRRLTNYAETLKRGTRLEIHVRCDDFLFSEVARELGFAPKQRVVERAGLFETLRSFAEPLRKSEIEFYRRYRLSAVAEHLEGLAVGDGVLLCLGWGGGWSSKTITRAFLQRSDFDFMRLRRVFRLGQSRSQRDFYHTIFPKSRRLVASPALMPLGWVCIRGEV